MLDRCKNYRRIKSLLTELSDWQLLQMIDTGAPVHQGIGGRSTRLDIESCPVFAKKIPLTDLERQDNLRLCTANIFHLPLYCQYGVGSPGFGAWREVVAHMTATDWVLTGQCASFPILYHWRVLPSSNREPMNMDEWGNLDNFVKFWDGDEAVRKRVQAIDSASFDLVLLLEYIPQTLYDWLTARLSGEEGEAAPALKFVEENLKTTNLFMQSKGFVHFDAHFKNILTDGRLIYVSDFGLALASQFDLSPEESLFSNGTSITIRVPPQPV